MEIEKRFSKFQLRKEGNKIEGYVMRWDEIANIGGMAEKFEPNSIRIDPDAMMLWDHNESQILGRMSKNLKFEDREDGLMYSLELPKTTLADDIRELVSKGILDGASLGFVPEKERMQDGVRVIEDATLKELSLVGNPSYKSSTANLRKKKSQSYHWGRLILDV